MSIASLYGEFQYDGKEYFPIEFAELTHRVFPGWWGDAQEGEAYTREYSALARESGALAVDTDRKIYRVYWQFVVIKGEEPPGEFAYDWSGTYVTRVQMEHQDTFEGLCERVDDLQERMDDLHKRLEQFFCIQFNNCAISRPCGLCGERTDPDAGPEIFLKWNWRLICDQCAWRYAPALAEARHAAFPRGIFETPNRSRG
jgi:hypothetical protein